MKDLINHCSLSVPPAAAAAAVSVRDLHAVLYIQGDPKNKHPLMSNRQIVLKSGDNYRLVVKFVRKISMGTLRVGI